MVEAAIILPVIVLLTFGMIDFGIGFNQKAGLDSASRAGVRLGATDTTTDNTTPTSTPGGTIPQNTQIGFDSGSAVNAALSQVASKVQLVNMFVFRSASNGTTWVPQSMTAGACTSDCIEYFPESTNNGQFNLYSSGNPAGGLAPVGTWPAPQAPDGSYPDRNACVVNADRVNIQITARYRFLTALIGTTITLTSTSAAQLEPTSC